MREAIDKEWRSLLDSGAVQVVNCSEVPVGENVVRARCVLTLKDVACGGVATGEKRAKCRAVILGLEQVSPGDAKIDSPTEHKVTARVALQVAVSSKWRSASGDITTAFLRGDLPEKPFHAEIPKGMSLPETQCMKCLKGVYGTQAAPMLWFNKCSRNVVAKTNATQCKLDKCCFLWYQNETLIGCALLHVDGLRCFGNETFCTETFPVVQGLSPFGGWDYDCFNIQVLRLDIRMMCAITTWGIPLKRSRPMVRKTCPSIPLTP